MLSKIDSFKYFIGYINETDLFPVPLCAKLPQMNGYVKHFGSNNKWINLLFYIIKNCWEKYIDTWDKISNLLKKGLDSETVYNDKYIKTKMKI